MAEKIIKPRNLKIIFKPFCEGCECGEYYVENEYYIEQREVYSLSCVHLEACSVMNERCLNESERVSE